MVGQNPFKRNSLAADGQLGNERFGPRLRIDPHGRNLGPSSSVGMKQNRSKLLQFQNALFCYKKGQIVLFTPVHLFDRITIRAQINADLEACPQPDSGGSDLIDRSGPLPDDDLPPGKGHEMETDTEPDLDDATSFTDALGRPDVPTDHARIEAQRSEAPSTMRKVEHGVTVDGHETFKMAEKLQSNDATLRFPAALNFDADEGAEPGVEVVDTAIEKAAILDGEEDDLPPPTARTADPVEIERADVASARATQCTERAPGRRPRSRASRCRIL